MPYALREATKVRALGTSLPGSRNYYYCHI